MFKRLLMIFLASLMIVGVWTFNSRSVFYGYSDKLTIYFDESSSGEMLTINSNNFSLFSGVKGESIVVDKNTFNLHNFIKDFDCKVLFIEECEEGQSIYGYSDKIRYKKVLHGEVVNLHIFIGEKNLSLGSPIIFGSF